MTDEIVAGAISGIAGVNNPGQGLSVGDFR